MPYLSGSFLIARPSLKDPSFLHSVVLILKHEAEGAFGLVVNRPSSVEGLPFPVFMGGPCAAEGLILLHGQNDWIADDPDQPRSEIASGIFLGNADCLKRINDPPPEGSFRFRVFLGYAGWGPDQLEQELAAGAWAVVPATAQLLFESPVEELWSNLLPPAIPQPSMN
jgi:putative transcriptional regulator